MEKLKEHYLLALLASFLTLAGCASMSDFNSEPYWTREFYLDGPGALEVETSGGNITVSSHEGNQVRVEMIVRVKGRSIDSSDAKAREVLEDYRIDISKSGNTVVARAERKKSGWFDSNNTSISFRMYVPEAISTNLNTSGGTISIEGLKGQQDIRTSGGSLSIKRIEGDLKAKTSGGSIQVSDYKGSLDGSTSGGTIKLENASGDLAVSTSGGSITLQNVSGSIDANTSGGSINANILALNRQLTLHTSGGSIYATVPQGLGLDLNLSGNKVNTTLQNFDGEVEDDKVRGKINGGGIPVKLSTSGGSVNLKYQ